MTKREKAKYCRQQTVENARWRLMQLGQTLYKAMGLTTCGNNLKEDLWTVGLIREVAALQELRACLCEEDWTLVKSCWQFEE